MILIDFTQIAIGGLMAQMHRGSDALDERLVRHVVLNTLRSVSYTHLTLPTKRIV